MQRSVDAVVDVMKVPASGDASLAVLPVGSPAVSRLEDCELLIAGGGTGGVAAAIAAARAGRRVVLLEETDWLGGQLTAQGVSALDEHEHIESCGGTRSYYQLRNAIRRHYGEPNPGHCWVTRLAFEPRVAVGVIERMLPPQVSIYRRTKTVAVTTVGDRITEVVAMGLDDGRTVCFRPALVIDATELGDLLPLSGAETIAETGEPQAQPAEPKPHCVQSFTYTFACERRPRGERHVIAKPEKYEHYKAAQPYSLRIEVHAGGGGASAAGREAGQPRVPVLASAGSPGTQAATRRDGHRRRVVEASLYPRGAAHQGEEDDRRAGSVGALPAGCARRDLRRFGRRRLVSDRHPSLRARRRRRELPHQALPAPARRAAAGAYRQPHRRREEHRHHAYHQRLLPAAPGGVERGRGGRRAGGVCAAGADHARCSAGDAVIPVPGGAERAGRPPRLADEFMMEA